MTTSIAFFLSQTGDLIHVPLNHIGTVIANPERFGLTPTEIENVYKDYGERVGMKVRLAGNFFFKSSARAGFVSEGTETTGR